MTKAIVKDRFRQLVEPRSEGQAAFIETVEKNTITLVDGLAGTGKTFLAAALAVKYLKEGRVEKIVMTRPAVEAGESLGFLPGTFEEKIDPYLRPLYDSLEMLFTFEEAARLQNEKRIEVIPLAYMRGRTLKRSFLILDEAQNTSPAQMKMFLTRIGKESAMIVAGDSTQRDLPGTHSGFSDALHRLAKIKNIGLVRLEKSDIVRSAIVSDIVEAYEK